MKGVKLAVLGAALLLGVALGLYFFRFREAPVFPVLADGITSLPEPRLHGGISVEEVIKRRRSIRSYADSPLTLAEVGQLLWAAQGITDPKSGFRAAPSAGATYPLEVHLVVGEGTVAGLAAGVYRYLPEGHRLERRLAGDLRARLAAAALGQPWVEAAPITIVITAIYQRTTARYGERGVRYVHLEAGHVGQNIYLQAVALELGTVAVGAFRDAEVAELLGLPQDEVPLYLFPVGRKRT